MKSIRKIVASHRLGPWLWSALVGVVFYLIFQLGWRISAAVLVPLYSPLVTSPNSLGGQISQTLIVNMSVVLLGAIPAVVVTGWLLLGVFGHRTLVFAAVPCAVYLLLSYPQLGAIVEVDVIMQSPASLVTAIVERIVVILMLLSFVLLMRPRFCSPNQALEPTPESSAAQR